MSFVSSVTLALLAGVTAAGDTGGDDGRVSNPTGGQRDLYTQFVISSALGLGAFFSFCVCLAKSDMPVFNGILMD